MYLGPITQTLPLYRDVYYPGLGLVPRCTGVQERTLERYRCEHCGHELRVLERASEPFYCRCGALVDV